MNKTEQIQAELARVKGNKELLKPGEVVEWAHRNEDSALHSCFEWDDGKAGHQYRVWQARSLIALHIVTEKGERRTVSLSIDRAKEGGYREVEDVMRSPALREVMFKDAIQELMRIRDKYANLKELAKLFKEIERLHAVEMKKIAA